MLSGSEESTPTFVTRRLPEIVDTHGSITGCTKAWLDAETSSPPALRLVLLRVKVNTLDIQARLVTLRAHLHTRHLLFKIHKSGRAVSEHPSLGETDGLLLISSGNRLRFVPVNSSFHQRCHPEAPLNEVLDRKVMNGWFGEIDSARKPAARGHQFEDENTVAFVFA